MMGTKKLSEIRAELQQALAKTTNDPIQWLDERIRESERENNGKSGANEVLESLRMLLGDPIPKKRRKPLVVKKSK